MEAVTGFLEGLTVFHWLGIGLILLTLEVAVGTFDLLWIAVASGLPLQLHAGLGEPGVRIDTTRRREAEKEKNEDSR